MQKEGQGQNSGYHTAKSRFYSLSGKDSRIILLYSFSGCSMRNLPVDDINHKDISTEVAWIP